MIGTHTTRSVLRPQPVPEATRRVFLLHHAGGSHLLFRDWVRHFPADWEVCLLEAPGRGRLSDLPLIGETADLVSFFLEDMVPLLDRPFVLFGHSMGALAGYELTHQIVASGLRKPDWLGLSARAAPRPDGGLDLRTRHLMPPAELRRSLADMGGTPREVLEDPDWWEFLEPMLRSDLRLVETWRPAPGTPVLPVPVSAFGGDRDVVVRPQRLADWGEHTTRYLGLHLYPGDHFYFRSYVKEFVDRIVSDVRKAVDDGTHHGG